MSLTLSQIALIHVKSSYPVTTGSIADWLCDQAPGVDRSNCDTLAEDWVAQAKRSGLIRQYDPDPMEEVTWMPT